MTLLWDLLSIRQPAIDGEGGKTEPEDVSASFSEPSLRRARMQAWTLKRTLAALLQLCASPSSILFFYYQLLR